MLRKHPRIVVNPQQIEDENKKRYCIDIFLFFLWGGVGGVRVFWGVAVCHREFGQ